MTERVRFHLAARQGTLNGPATKHNTHTQKPYRKSKEAEYIKYTKLSYFVTDFALPYTEVFFFEWNHSEKSAPKMVFFQKNNIYMAF